MNPGIAVLVIPTPTATITGELLEINAQENGRFINLPLTGAGGFFGMTSIHADAAAGIITVPQLKPALTFLNPLP